MAGAKREKMTSMCDDRKVQRWDHNGPSGSQWELLIGGVWWVNAIGQDVCYFSFSLKCVNMC